MLLAKVDVNRVPLWIVVMAVLAYATAAVAYDGDGDDGVEEGEAETAELARAVQNPVADLISVPFQNNTNFEFGPRDKSLNVLNIQPVWPFRLTKDWNVITRTILPIVSQPGVAPGQDRESGLGDIVVTAFLSPAKPGLFTWGFGPAVLVPTATDNRLGANKWGLGPSAVFLAMPGNWVVGSLFSNIWSTGGSGNTDVNLFTWQYFVNYNLPDGWYLTSSPVVTANWEADRSGDKWTVPFGGGVGKIFRIGRLPLNAQVQTFYNAVKPDLSGRWNLRVQLQFLFPK